MQQAHVVFYVCRIAQLVFKPQEEDVSFTRKDYYDPSYIGGGGYIGLTLL